MAKATGILFVAPVLPVDVAAIAQILGNAKIAACVSLSALAILA
jgi:hypothetical protein